MRARVLLPGEPLDDTLRFFVEQLGFVLRRIGPADDPREAVLDGPGVQIELRRELTGPSHLRLCTDDPAMSHLHGATAPNGTQLWIGPATPTLQIPDLQPEFAVFRADECNSFVTGRAGMLYRDLVYSRLGGRFIVSHIRIPKGGPVPDYSHHHLVRAQVIACLQGWVRVAYQDQGPAFDMQPGDVVLQPPGIRHRVLACSDGTEVLELTSPAEHHTFTDPDCVLPSDSASPGRTYGGQRFRHFRRAEPQRWEPSRFRTLDVCDSGVAEASGGAIGVRTLRAAKAAHEHTDALKPAADELTLWFVRTGEVTLEHRGERHRLAAQEGAALCAGALHRPLDPSPDLQLLQITVPGTQPDDDSATVGARLRAP
ncbi:MAG: hypothetical protein KTR31_39310 [Myxococcales bacterium]|nr:hypothetical protein [Myxococcales bacterium]